MKKLIIIIPLLQLGFFKVYAQEQNKEPKPKMNLISVSEGVGGHTSDIYQKIFPGLTDDYTVKSKPLFKLFYERNIVTVFDNCYLGIGLEFSQKYFDISISNSNDDYLYLNSYDYYGKVGVKIFYIAPRVSLNYVFPNNPKWRAYACVNLGLAKYNATGSETYTYYDYSGNYDHSEFYQVTEKGSVLGKQAYLGIRYFAFNSVGLFAEAGYGMSYVNGGLNLRF